MSETLVVRQNMFVTPPRASSATTPTVGEEVKFAVSATPTYLEMDALLQQTVVPITPSQQQKGVMDNFITIAAESATLYVIFGPTSQSVITSAAAAKSGTHGSVATASAGYAVYTDATANAFVAGDVGKYIVISGATLAVNNGTFLITAYGSATHVTIANPWANTTGELNNGSQAWSEYALANAPTATGHGTVVSGLYTRSVGTGFPIPVGTSIRFRLQKGMDNFMGIVASGAGYCSVYQSSPANP